MFVEEKIKLTYTPAQLQIFFEVPDNVKYIIVTKGRRFGATRGAAHAFIEWALEGKHLLWGDTIHSNIDRYFERYFIPALKLLPNNIVWNYQKKEKKLNIGPFDGYVDFRSADRPENWEGFGYDVIFLNEAGIILKNKYLYANTVLPMLLDSEKSKLIAVGVPKGKKMKDKSDHPFYTLYKTAKSGAPGYKLFEFSSYDNPLLSKEEITELEKEINRMSSGMVEQEIYGKFVDDVSGTLWGPELFKYTDEVTGLRRIVIGVDPSGSVSGDEVGIVAAGVDERGFIYVLKDVSGHYSPLHWGTLVVDLYRQLRADVVVVEKNFGGDMVKSNIQTIDRAVRIKEVFASRAKQIRAEPIVALYEQGRIYHKTGLHNLENEMLSWVPGLGASPNRIDALVWAVTELMTRKIEFEVI